MIKPMFMEVYYIKIKDGKEIRNAIANCFVEAKYS